MSLIVFLLEEPSMQALLETLLPRIFPGLTFQCVPHEGKRDLQQSIPRKLKAWRAPGVRFVVVHDNDAADCRALKKSLSDMCRDAGRDDTLVRIACQELEAWYFGEPEALAHAYGQPALAAYGGKSQYRDPDSIPSPAARLKELVPAFQKTSGARLMGALLTPERNRSKSFQSFIDGVRALAPTGQTGQDRAD